jgi:hypothetical protein
MRRKIRHIEGNAKCRNLKNLPRKGTLRQVFICLRNRTPYPTPLHTVVYNTGYLVTQGRGRGGGELNQRKGERGSSSKSWDENTKMTDCISPVYKP